MGDSWFRARLGWLRVLLLVGVLIGAGGVHDLLVDVAGAPPNAGDSSAIMTGPSISGAQLAAEDPDSLSQSPEVHALAIVPRDALLTVAFLLLLLWFATGTSACRFITKLHVSRTRGPPGTSLALFADLCVLRH